MNTTGRRNKYAGEVPKIDHKELVSRAASYLQNSLGCSIIFKERIAATSENPDAIGFGGREFSVLIECKTSRADFLADKKKHFRKRPEFGMGHKRYFMSPVGMLEPSEILDGWGLLEVYEKHHRNRTVKIAKESSEFYSRNKQAEIQYLVSAIRRINISMAVLIAPAESEIW